MNETSEDKVVKEAERKHKNVQRDQLTRLNTNLNKELEMTQGELDVGLAYYDKLTLDLASATKIMCSSARRISNL